MAIVKTLNFPLAERKYFSGYNDRWVIRNAIKRHPMRKYVRLEALFTEMLIRINKENSSITAEDCAVLAAIRLLAVLDSLELH